MKTLLLVAGGRGGSDFFQGLLDNHPQILSLPLYLRIDDGFIDMLSGKDPHIIASKFLAIFPEFFNSKLNKLERWNRLGKKKNSYFKINKENFINHFTNLYNSKNPTNFEKLKFLHLAYALCKGEKLRKKKILFIHTHLVYWTSRFIEEFKPKNFEIIHIIRHPLAALSAPIKNWLNFKNGASFFSRELYFQIDLVFKGISDLMKLGKVKIIQYEYLHWYHKKVMNDFCKIYKIKYDNCLKESTKNGLKWWGDSISGKWLNGINSSFKINIDRRYFFKRDIQFFQFLNERIIKYYNYDFLTKKKKNYFNIFPMKCELLVWKNSFKHLIFNFRWKHFVSIPYFYLLRIFLINNFTIYKKKLPYSIGSKKLKN